MKCALLLQAVVAIGLVGLVAGGSPAKKPKRNRFDFPQITTAPQVTVTLEPSATVTITVYDTAIPLVTTTPVHNGTFNSDGASPGSNHTLEAQSAHGSNQTAVSDTTSVAVSTYLGG